MSPNVPPLKWKTAILVWLAIYPTITLISFVFGDRLLQLSVPLRTWVMTLVLVPLMVYVLLPLLQKLFSKWLYK